MTVDEIFNTIAAHMEKGVRIHKAMMQAYDFLALKGYSKCQEYHYIEETNNYLNLLHYYMITYQKLIEVKEPIEIDIIPASWYKHTREDVDNNTRRSAIKELMIKWVQWEKSTKTLLQQMYRELDALNEVAAAMYVKNCIEEVESELQNAQQKQLELETINYDLVEIIDEQPSYYHKYCKGIKKKK